jgi:hypothetical protein
MQIGLQKLDNRFPMSNFTAAIESKSSDFSQNGISIAQALFIKASFSKSFVLFTKKNRDGRKRTRKKLCWFNLVLAQFRCSVCFR